MAVSRAIAADGEQATNTERLVTSALTTAPKLFLPVIDAGAGATVAADFTVDIYANSTGAILVVDATGHFVATVRPGTGTTFQATGDATNNKWVTQEITKVYQKQRGLAPVVLAYSTVIATDASLSDIFSITASDTVAFTISNPTNAKAGDNLSYILKNASGGVMGTITWGAAFKVVAITKPATGFNRTISFVFDGTNWIEVGLGAIDIPN